MNLPHWLTRGIVALGAIALPGLAIADEPVTLRIADSYPSNHIIHRIVTKPFMAEVKRLAGDKVQFQHFPGEQLGRAKDYLLLTRSGVMDIGSVTPAYQSDKMPLSSVFELPGAFKDYCGGMKALWKLTRSDGFLGREEFARNGVYPLMTFMIPTYQLVLGGGRQPSSLKELQGMKIRSGGGAMDFMLEGLGMVPVRLAPPEVYESLSRGTIDGAIFPYQSAVSYGLDGLIKRGTTTENFGTVAMTYSISLKRLQALPADVRAVLLQAGEKITADSCAQFLAAEGKARDKVRGEGMQPMQFPDADREPLTREFEAVATQWATSLDRRNKPGSEALAALRDALGTQP